MKAASIVGDCIARISELEHQQDALVAALKRATRLLAQHSGEPIVASALYQARAAIEKAEQS